MPLGDFQPQPPEPHPSTGVAEYPGFHTANDIEIAATYATSRQLQLAGNGTIAPGDFFRSWDGERETIIDAGEQGFVSDYPVIVELDMRGLEKLTDYDAEQLVRFDAIADDLESTVGSGPFASDQIADALEQIEEFEFQQDISEVPTDGLSWVGSLFAGRFYDADAIRRVFEANPQLAADFATAVIAGGPYDPAALMLAVGQFRYLERVAARRVLAVHYVKPVASELFIDDGEHDDVEDRWPGFTIGEYTDFAPRFDITEVWRRRAVPDPEFHGTSFARFGLAAPGVRRHLPMPPSPPLNIEAFEATIRGLRNRGKAA